MMPYKGANRTRDKADDELEKSRADTAEKCILRASSVGLPLLMHIYCKHNECMPRIRFGSNRSTHDRSPLCPGSSIGQLHRATAASPRVLDSS